MIKVEKITKIYGKRSIFSDFSYTFPDKGLFALVGSSGSGKSTLLNLISGVDNNYKGTIKFDKTVLTKLSNDQLAEFRINNIGYVFQNFNLLNLDTVFNNVSLPLESSYKSKRFISRKRVMDALKLVRLSSLAKQRVNKLSGGEKQRVAIARAIINDPKVVLCDEPTGALDEKNSKAIFNLLKVISKNTLVIVATHDVQSISKIADTILEIHDGHVSIKEQNSRSYKSEIRMIGKGRKKISSNVPFLFKIRYGFQKLKAKKFRSIITNLMLSLSLTGIGLSMIITDSVSGKVEEAFQSILNGNYVIISNKNEKDNSFSTAYSARFESVEKIYNKYQFLLDGVGVNYMVNFEDFFKDDNEFFVSTKNKNISISSLSARSINDFKWLSEFDTKIYYPNSVDLLDDDQVVLGLSYEDMVNLCFSLQIQRNYTALGHYIYEKGLSLTLNVKNDFWQYDDEQLLAITAVCESNYTCIYHTNLLWNEYMFEEMMRIPSDDDDVHEYPWEMLKLYYLKTKEKPGIFLNSALYDDNLYDYVFERANYKYNPTICKEDLCDENRVYVYAVDKKTIYGSVINKYKEINNGFKNFYFTSDFGYASFGSNLFSGFAKNLFISLNDSLIDEAIDADTQLKDTSSVALNLPSQIVQGNYLLSMKNGLRFSTYIKKLISGREANNINEIVISKGLAEKLDKNRKCLGKTVEIAAEIEENYNSSKQIEKTYNKTKLLVVGIAEEENNYIYQDNNWTIEFFRDKLGVSSFYLIPKAIVCEFKTQEEAKKAMNDLNSVITGYKIESPIEELKVNIDTSLEYANTILKVFSLLSAIISVLLLATTMMLNIIESQEDVKLFSLLGIKKHDINSCFVVQSVMQGLISFVISSIELVAVDIIMSILLGNILQIGIKFSINGKPLLFDLAISIIIPLIVSNILLLILNRKVRVNRLN